MNDETAAGSSGAPDDGGHRGGRLGEQSPLQARAAFLANWNWQSVTDLNRGLCSRGSAQHGFNSESGETCGREWEAGRTEITSLVETLDRLRGFHRKAPFLFFNGNTFADIARGLFGILFRDLPASRLKQITSAVAHYVAGVLDREAMASMVESLSQISSFQPGDRVKTLKGTLSGVIVRILDDGRVKWRAETGTELIALRDNLLPDP
jgi:hypothetical protein